MTVSEIIELIAIVSFNDDNPSATDRARILRYINLANDQVFSKVSQIGSAFISQNTNLTLVNNEVALPTDHYKTIRVVDTTNNAVITAKEVEAIEEELDPSLSQQGRPQFYYIEGGNIKVWPLQDVNLRMRYTPVNTPLVDETSADNILYPAPFHQVLVDGGLYYMFEDERDRRAIQEIAIAGQRFDDRLAALIEYYRNESREPQTVDYQDF